MNRKIFILIVFMTSSSAWAGIKWIDVGVNGLTCSMCSRSVEMSISRLDFVDSVSMSLEKTEGRIYIKNQGPIDLRKIAKAIVDAGFSVRFVRLQFDLTDVTISKDRSFTYLAQTYLLVESKNEILKMASFKLVDDGFLPHKEATQWRKKIEAMDGGSAKKVLHVVQE